MERIRPATWESRRGPPSRAGIGAFRRNLPKGKDRIKTRTCKHIFKQRWPFSKQLHQPESRTRGRSVLPGREQYRPRTSFETDSFAQTTGCQDLLEWLLLQPGADSHPCHVAKESKHRDHVRHRGIYGPSAGTARTTSHERS